MNLISLGKRIKYLRINKAKLSQEDFSKKIGLDRSYLSRIESGNQNVTITILFKIICGLDVDLKDFFDFENYFVK